MRGAFVRTIVELAAADRRVLLLTGDLGYMALEPFIEQFPDRFFNMGVAEQNMVGVATGLAEAGFLPFVYSINPFAVLRPYEFIRNGPIAHQLPVRIVGIGGGFEYGRQGPSHHGLEDLAVMRVHPGLTVVAPADHRQTVTAVRKTWNRPGPVYYRLGKDDRTTVPGLDGRFTVGGAESLRTGTDVVLVTTGSVAVEAAAAVDALVTRGVDAGLLVVASVQPAPVADLAAALRAAPLCLTVEAHYLVGGIGSLVAEVIAEQRLPCRLLRCGVRRAADGMAGTQGWLHQAHGLSRDALTDAVLQALGRAGPAASRRSFAARFRTPHLHVMRHEGSWRQRAWSRFRVYGPGRRVESTSDAGRDARRTQRRSTESGADRAARPQDAASRGGVGVSICFHHGEYIGAEQAGGKPACSVHLQTQRAVTRRPDVSHNPGVECSSHSAAIPLS